MEATRSNQTAEGYTTSMDRFSSVDEQMRYAKALAASSMLPDQYRDHPENVLWAMSYADMLGMHHMVVITGMHNMNGKPTASSAFISMLARRAGHRLDVWTEGPDNDPKAIATITRADSPDATFRVEWTLNRAHSAGITKKGTWKAFPAAMLKARATTEVCRDATSDALFGILYTPEELGADNVDEHGMVVSGETAQPTASVPDSNQSPAVEEYSAPAVESTPEPREEPPPVEAAPEAALGVPMRDESEFPDEVNELAQKVRSGLADGPTHKLPQVREWAAGKCSETHPVIAEIDAEIQRRQQPDQEQSGGESFDWEGAIEDAQRDGNAQDLEALIEGAPDGRTAGMARAALKKVRESEAYEAAEAIAA